MRSSVGGAKDQPFLFVQAFTCYYLVRIKIAETLLLNFNFSLNREFLKRPNNLKIPPFEPGSDHTPSPVLSPEGRVAARLEKISQEIMGKVPHLLDEPLKIMQAGNLSYEQFCVAARHLTFEHQIVGWSKVALLCHFAREVAIVGELDDLQLELLADHSFRFIQESTEEWIEKNGGWVSTWCSVFCTTL